MLIGLNSHKATGLDGMPARVIIDSANIICKPLCHIVYLSIQSGEFPCDIKKTKITPIYLTGANVATVWHFAVVMELPDSLWMNCKSEFSVIFLRCSPT